MFSPHLTVPGGPDTDEGDEGADSGRGGDDGDPILQRVSTLVREYISSD